MDGTIYNYRELRSQLESYGCKFQGNFFPSLLVMVMPWNSACFMRLNGLFALAIWVADDKTGAGTGSHWSKTALLFIPEIHHGLASETGSPTPLFKAEIGVEGLSELICLSPRNTPETLLKGIHELRPKHYLTFSPDGSVVSRYWRIEEREDNDSAEETARQIRN